jgi:hypothetical protein
MYVFKISLYTNHKTLKNYGSIKNIKKKEPNYRHENKDVSYLHTVKRFLKR